MRFAGKCGEMYVREVVELVKGTKSRATSSHKLGLDPTPSQRTLGELDFCHKRNDSLDNISASFLYLRYCRVLTSRNDVCIITEETNDLSLLMYLT